jgi:flavin-dependent dehydrogenase
MRGIQIMLEQREITEKGAMMKAKQITSPEKYKNKDGEEFEYTIHRHDLDPTTDYWLFTIQAKHSSWGFRAFGVYAKKSTFPNQDMAEHLAKSLATDEMKSRLNQATSEGFPLVFPIFSDGWFLL